MRPHSTSHPSTTSVQPTTALSSWERGSVEECAHRSSEQGGDRGRRRKEGQDGKQDKHTFSHGRVKAHALTPILAP